MPISSAWARSIPDFSALSPLKILPPPTTTAISIPASWTLLISFAYCKNYSLAINAVLPVAHKRDSPLSLSRMRLYFIEGGLPKNINLNLVLSIPLLFYSSNAFNSGSALVMSCKYLIESLLSKLLSAPAFNNNLTQVS